MTDETDWGAFEDLEQSIALARSTHAPDALVRGLANLAAIRLMAGEARASNELMTEARNVAERFGLGVGVRWVQGQEPGFGYLEGRWDEAFRQANEFIAEVEAGSPHYQEAECRLIRGRIRLARGDIDGALEDARKEVVVARAAGDPQVLQPGLSFSARVYATTGNTSDADALAGELLEQAPLYGFYADDLAWAMRDLGRGEEFLERAFPPIQAGREPTLWRLAACAVAAGDLAQAAELYRRVGSVPDEAYAVLVAAEEGGAVPPELERALTFFREVGATAYLERGEALLAKSA
jgi:tetratricopeptide (TPR) repeat protein